MNFTYKIELNDIIKITAADKIFNNYVCELDVSYLNTNIYSLEILFNMLNDHIEKIGIEEDNVILNAIYKDDKIYMTLSINYKYNPSKIDFILEKVICNTDISKITYLENKINKIIPELMERIDRLERQARLSKLCITDRNLTQYTKLFISPYEIIVSIGDTGTEPIDKKIEDFDVFMCNTNGMDIFRDFIGIDTIILYNVKLDFNIFDNFELKHLSLYSCDGEYYKQYVYGLESLTLIDTPMDYLDLNMEIIVSPELIKGSQQQNVRIHEIYDMIKGEFTGRDSKRVYWELAEILNKNMMYIVEIIDNGYDVKCNGDGKYPPYSQCRICENAKKVNYYVNKLGYFDISTISKMVDNHIQYKIQIHARTINRGHNSVIIDKTQRVLRLTDVVLKNIDLVKQLIE